MDRIPLNACYHKIKGKEMGKEMCHKSTEGVGVEFSC